MSFWERLKAANKPAEELPVPDTTSSPTPTQLYTVSIPHLTEYQADALIQTYAGAWKTKE